MRTAALFYLLQTLVTTAAPAPGPVCPAGTAVAYFRLEARRADAAYAIPIDRVNRLRKGDTVVFFPSDPPVPTDVSGARVALMVLTSDSNELKLLETKKGNARQEWTLPADAAAIAVAYGPRGLDDDKMRQATTKDPELIAQLAAYSEKTAQTEIVLSALSGRRQNDDRAVDAALLGLASTPGGAKLDRNASLDQQTMTLIRTLNPAIGAYDPLAPEPQQRWQQSAMLASSVAGLFFGNTVGLAGGGAALFLNMRTLMFPRTELRSALLREAPEPALCAAKPSASRTKFAYLWARQLPGGTAPKLKLAKPVHLALGQPGVAALDAAEPDLAAAGRAFRWKLVDGAGKEHIVPVTLPATETSLRIGPVPAKWAPGRYRLIAEWDWNTVAVEGDIELHSLPELSSLRLTPDTADRLVPNSGAVRVRLNGAPAYFVQSLRLLRLGDALAQPAALPFAADGEGLEFEVNTNALAVGPYTLTIVQQGGAKAELAIAVQAPAPVIENLPLREMMASVVGLDPMNPDHQGQIGQIMLGAVMASNPALRIDRFDLNTPGVGMTTKGRLGMAGMFAPEGRFEVRLRGLEGLIADAQTGALGPGVDQDTVAGLVFLQGLGKPAPEGPAGTLVYDIEITPDMAMFINGFDVSQMAQ